MMPILPIVALIFIAGLIALFIWMGTEGVGTVSTQIVPRFDGAAEDPRSYDRERQD